MNIQLIFGICVALGVVAWSVFSAFYIWPALLDRSRADALRPLVMLHAFRFVGLAFLVPGVVAPDLPAMSRAPPATAILSRAFSRFSRALPCAASRASLSHGSSIDSRVSTPSRPASAHDQFVR
jgi:hypothetical protein